MTVSRFRDRRDRPHIFMVGGVWRVTRYTAPFLNVDLDHFRRMWQFAGWWAARRNIDIKYPLP